MRPLRPACPYEARFVDPASNTLDKCTLCDGRVRQGLAPACFEVCPAQARLYREGGLTVGDVEAVDPGHEVVRRVDDDLDPGPTLRVSGRPEDLNLLEKELPLKRDEAIPAALWRDGAGLMVQGLGMASILAMAGMLSLRVLRGRRGQDAGSGPDETIHDGENTHG
jgi:tetrathionate reductase subunit B